MSPARSPLPALLAPLAGLALLTLLAALAALAPAHRALTTALTPALTLHPAHALTPSAPALPAALTAALTAAPHAPPTRVWALGDSRAEARGLGPSARWPELRRAALSRRPALMLHLGDWVRDGHSGEEWRRALGALPPGLPLLTTRGNHDRGAWWARLGLDGLGAGAASPLRAAHLGAALVYLLDSEGDEAATRAAVEAHAAWRAARPRPAPLVLLATHRPLWSRGPHGDDERGWGAWLAPALDALGVDLLLAGHDHDYERMAPTPGGVTCVVSGGAGTWRAPLPGLSRRPDRPDRPASLVFSARPHSLSLEVRASSLTLEAWATPREGVSELIDSVVVEGR